MHRPRLAILLSLALVACAPGADEPLHDAEPAAPRDAAPEPADASAPDAQASASDAGALDAGALDAGALDAGALDAGAPPCPSGDAPTITAPLALVEGVPTDVFGCRFGDAPHAAPLVWDDFEDGVADAALHAPWRAYRTESARYTSEEPYSGRFAAANEVWAGSGRSFTTSYQETEPTEQMYLSYVFRFRVTGDPYGILKLSRIASDYDGELTHTPHYNGPGSLAWTYQPDAEWSYAIFEAGDDSLQQTTGSVLRDWHRIEMFIRASTPGVPDGAVWLAQNGRRTWELENVVTRSAGLSFRYHSVLLGLMLANPRADGHFWMAVDDVLAVSSQARVELGDAPRFEDCTRREVQPYEGWSDGRVRITPRLARLDPRAPLYLFVIDPDGRPSAGAPVTVEVRDRASR